MSKREIMIGSRVGHWTLLDKVKSNGKEGSKWLCRCACGEEKLVFQKHLKRGASLSCGCHKRESDVVEGYTSGLLTAIECVRKEKVNGRWNIYWRCRCVCGEEVVTRQVYLKSGSKIHCGGDLHK